MENMAANAEVVQSVQDSVDITTPETGAAAGDETSAAPSAPQHEDVTQTQAFSHRLTESVDREIAGLGLTNEFNGQPIRTKADLRAWNRMREAEAAGRDPESAATEAGLRDELSAYRMREQEAEIKADPDLAPYYDEFRDDILEVCEMAQADGREVNLAAATRAVMSQNMGTILQRTRDAARQETIKNYDSKSKASPGSIGGSETSPPLDYASMSDEQFEDVMRQAVRGELMRS